MKFKYESFLSKENPFQKAAYKMLAILFRHQCVNWDSHMPLIRNPH